MRWMTREIFGPKTLLLGVMCLGPIPGSLWAQGPRTETKFVEKTAANYLQLFKPAVKSASSATVRIICLGKEVALGTVVDTSGLILTKASEVKYPPKCKLPDGREIEAEVVAVEEKHDLMLLKVAHNGLSAVTLVPGEKQNATAGKWVVSSGISAEAPLAVGVISVAARKIEQSFLQRGLPNLASHGFMGVTPNTTDEEGNGVPLESVEANGAAFKAGLKAGDIVIRIKGKAIGNSSEMMALMHTTRPGEVIDLKVRRGDQEMDFRLTLMKRPSGNPRGEMQNRMGGELSDRRTFFPAILQHDTILKPNECGGPLCDLDGNCLGINIARAGRVESYALPGDAVTQILKEMKAGKHPFSGQFAGELLIKEEVKGLEDESAKAAKAVEEAQAKLKEAQGKVEDAEIARKLAEKKLKEKQEQLQKAKDREQEIQKLKKPKSVNSGSLG